MSRIGLSLIGAICVIAPMQASADDLPAAPPGPVKPHAAKVKAAKPPAAKGEALGDIPFSNPYVLPVGAGKGAGGEFPQPRRPRRSTQRAGCRSPTNGMQRLSLQTRFGTCATQYGPDGPGSTFLGGLKLGF